MSAGMVDQRRAEGESQPPERRGRADSDVWREYDADNVPEATEEGFEEDKARETWLLDNVPPHHSG